MSIGTHGQSARNSQERRAADQAAIGGAAGAGRHRAGAQLRLWPDWPTREGTAFVSSEDLLKQADASVLMISATGPEVGLAQKLTSPIWRFVPARTAGRMALMPRNIWGFAGPMSAVRLSHQLTDSMLDAAKGAAVSVP